MYCQVCGLKNPDEEEFCSRCHSKLLVLSGVGVVEESGEAPEEIPFDEHLLERISTRITNEVPEINRVAVDITSKPPGTIEWE